jgi:hypothetical protein
MPGERVHFGNIPLDGERVHYSTDYPGTVPVGGTGPRRYDVVVVVEGEDGRLSHAPYEVPRGALVEELAEEPGEEPGEEHDGSDGGSADVPVPAPEPAGDEPAQQPGRRGGGGGA